MRKYGCLKALKIGVSTILFVFESLGCKKQSQEVAHLEVNNWSTCWLRFLKATMDHFLTRAFVSNMFLAACFC